MSQLLYRRLYSRTILAALFVFLAASGARSAYADTTITVDTAADDVLTGHCTLREAINSAVGVSGTGTCATGLGPYTILFNSDLAGETIKLATTLPAITGGTNLTINGPTLSSSGITIDGNGAVRLMMVLKSAVLTLNYVTLSNGRTTDVSADRSRGAGMINTGTVTINHSTLSNNNARTSARSALGGAIFNGGTLTIEDSTLSNNLTDCEQNCSSEALADGGALFNFEGNLTIINSTVANNKAAVTGSAAAVGGAIDNTRGTLTTSNVTFSGNQAVGRYAQGGGIFNDFGKVNLAGTILANSVGANCSNEIPGVVNDEGYNLADDNTCKFISGGTSKVVTTAEVGLAPSLGMNGGATQTIALISGGMATNFIPLSECDLTSDQRDYERPGESHPDTCSAGSFEFEGIAPELTVAPLEVNFGDVTVGETSVSQDVTLTNVSKTAPVMISIAIEGMFVQTSNCGAVLGPQDTCTIGVTFEPSTAGPAMGSLTITDSTPASHLVALGGNGVTIDCSKAMASAPNLISNPAAFHEEMVHGVTDPHGPFTIAIDSIRQDKPVPPRPPLCNGLIVNNTALVRADSQPPGGLLYTIGFTATDRGDSSLSCDGEVTICVQNSEHQGQPCLAPSESYDSTVCGPMPLLRR